MNGSREGRRGALRETKIFMAHSSAFVPKVPPSEISESSARNLCLPSETPGDKNFERDWQIA